MGWQALCVCLGLFPYCCGASLATLTTRGWPVAKAWPAGWLAHNSATQSTVGLLGMGNPRTREQRAAWLGGLFGPTGPPSRLPVPGRAVKHLGGPTNNDNGQPGPMRVLCTETCLPLCASNRLQARVLEACAWCQAWCLVPSCVGSATTFWLSSARYAPHTSFGVGSLGAVCWLRGARVPSGCCALHSWMHHTCSRGGIHSPCCCVVLVCPGACAE